MVSMGAGAHAGHALAHRLATHGRRAVNLTASEMLALGSPADSYLFVSEGGRSRETIDAARLAPSGTRLVLTNVPDSPLSQEGDVVIGLDAGEDSRVYTVGYTSTVQACGLLADALDGEGDGDDWAGLPGLASATLERLAAPTAAAAEPFARARSIDVVGAAGSAASTAGAALLLRESVRISTATYETYQYLHGPMEPLTPEHACLVFGDGREVALAGYLAGIGVPTVLVTSAEVPPRKGLTVLPIPPAPTMSRAVLEILPAQLLAGEVARLRGLAIDGFLYHQDDTKVTA
jgi:fructoselysine-6-P-deglycase FrlB-like protein